MSNQNRRLNYLFTILFIISIIYTTLRLFSLQDDLILSSQVLDSSQIASLSPVLLQLYFAVGSVILTGIILMAFSFKSETIDSQLINVGRNDKTDGKDASDDSNKTNNDSHSTKDLGFVVEVLKKAKSFEDKLEIVLKTLCKKLELGQGAIYSLQETDGIKSMKFLTGYAFSIAESETISFEFGEGLVGQSAKEGELLLVDDIPEGYINIISGLGKSSPKHLKNKVSAKGFLLINAILSPLFTVKLTFLRI